MSAIGTPLTTHTSDTHDGVLDPRNRTSGRLATVQKARSASHPARQIMLPTSSRAQRRRDTVLCVRSFLAAARRAERLDSRRQYLTARTIRSGADRERAVAVKARRSGPATPP